MSVTISIDTDATQAEVEQWFLDVLQRNAITFPGDLDSWNVEEAAAR